MIGCKNPDLKTSGVSLELNDSKDAIPSYAQKMPVQTGYASAACDPDPGRKETEIQMTQVVAGIKLCL